MHSHYTVTRFFVQANILLFFYNLVFKILEFCGLLLNYSSSHIIAQHRTIENLSVCVFVSILISWLTGCVRVVLREGILYCTC